MAKVYHSEIRCRKVLWHLKMAREQMCFVRVNLMGAAADQVAGLDRAIGMVERLIKQTKESEQQHGND